MRHDVRKAPRALAGCFKVTSTTWASHPPLRPQQRPYSPWCKYCQVFLSSLRCFRDVLTSQRFSHPVHFKSIVWSTHIQPQNPHPSTLFLSLRFFYQCKWDLFALPFGFLPPWRVAKCTWYSHPCFHSQILEDCISNRVRWWSGVRIVRCLTLFDNYKETDETARDLGAKGRRQPNTGR